MADLSRQALVDECTALPLPVNSLCHMKSDVHVYSAPLAAQYLHVCDCTNRSTMVDA